MDPRTGAVVPSNLVLRRPIRFGKDNLDTEKESFIMGRSAGFHGTQIFGYQSGPAEVIDVSEMKFSKDVPNIPESLHTVLELDRPIKKDPQYSISLQDVDTILDHDTSYESKEYAKSVATDMAFVMYRSQTDRRKDRKSNWTEFNKFLHKDNAKPATIVGQAPILNAKSDSHNTIYTVGE